MATHTVKNLKELGAFILIQMQETMKNTVAPEVKELESKVIKEVVYSSYDPKIYKRDMDNGGLSDVGNMYHNVINDGSSILLNIDNKTMSNPDYTHNYIAPFEISNLIEYGDGNGYGNYDFPYNNRDSDTYTYLKPRRFIKETRDQLENGKLRDMVIKGLKARGMNAI